MNGILEPDALARLLERVVEGLRARGLAPETAERIGGQESLRLRDFEGFATDGADLPISCTVALEFVYIPRTRPVTRRTQHDRGLLIRVTSQGKALYREFLDAEAGIQWAIAEAG